MRLPEQFCRLVAGLLLAFCAQAAEHGPGGSITGSVRLRGKPPAIPLVHPEHDVDVCGARARPAQSLLLGAHQAVGSVIIYLGGSHLGGSEANGKSLEAGKGAAVLDQRNCEFVPRIQVARSGAQLILKNSDPVLHVVRIDSLGGTNGVKTLLKVATPYAGFEKKYQLAHFKEPTLLRAVCGNGHNWMTAYIAVLPHPWAALTDSNGHFSIRNIPAGTHKVYAWHEALGTLAREVRVTHGRAAAVDFEFSAKQ